MDSVFSAHFSVFSLIIIEHRPASVYPDQVSNVGVFCVLSSLGF